ncbi:LOW QUALITY PROTEIN: metallophosphoesterase 1 [Gracilinanus agilis]|uniref:LOW QUALITY PROTEIN: metallophosphoesterase 1 n=1 Tax=Gracilinanus agilis TaxID=191870 RepID=UPI001CFDA55B|nr:LOW QUALITY PROTEIN: metallophosphoesterase 1 [Gracilinanus agilis]
MTKQRLLPGTLNFLRFKRKSWFFLKFGFLVFALIVFCEFLIYYLVIFQCHWPEVKTVASRGKQQTPEPVLKVIFLADTHLLGEVNGHWLDKLRREWQMERAFQTALWLLQPEVAFILGDVFDEGKWSSPKAWAADVERFRRVFRHPPETQLLVVAGNHDVGFHYSMNTYKLQRFKKVFDFGELFSIKGINFVMVNSVAMEGDGCTICSSAEAQLIKISHLLNCSRQEKYHSSPKCSGNQELSASAPILLQVRRMEQPGISSLCVYSLCQGSLRSIWLSLIFGQHYPLYRRSDADCTGEDSAPPEKKNILFKERYDVLSKEASQKLLWWFQPRLILSGHTHSACEVLHAGNIPEISVPSFSWRNRNNPSFIMGSVTSEDYSLSKCFLPLEHTVLTIYCTAGILVALLLFTHCQPS